jgi:hypothetical protein
MLEKIKKVEAFRTSFVHDTGPTAVFFEVREPAFAVFGDAGVGTGKDRDPITRQRCKQ